MKLTDQYWQQFDVLGDSDEQTLYVNLYTKTDTMQGLAVCRDTLPLDGIPATQIERLASLANAANKARNALLMALEPWEDQP